MTAADLGYAAFYAVSRNTRRWWSLEAGEALGFEPRDDAEDYASTAATASTGDIGTVQSGRYATPESTLERQRPWAAPARPDAGRAGEHAGGAAS